MKPLGMDAMFRVVRPTPAEDVVWDAVQRAIELGMTPRDFRLTAAEAWEQILREAGKDAAAELDRK